LVGSLLFDAFSVTRIYSIDDGMISEIWWIRNDLIGSGYGLILRYYYGIFLEGLKKTTKTWVKTAGRRHRDVNPAPHEYGGVLSTLPRCSVWEMEGHIWFIDKNRPRGSVLVIETFLT
jgi:hypothetical protein